MDATLSPRLPGEVLHDIGHVEGRTVEARQLERLVEDVTSGADEWVSLPVLLVTGLFADEHHPCVAQALSRHGLRCGLP
jgi:hypothetical protein